MLPFPEGLRPHLLDGTYELFRHHFGRQRSGRPPAPLDGVAGVCATVLDLLGAGVTHLGVATDHVIASFRNELWPSYKDDRGVPPEIALQFGPLEEALEALGLKVFAMREREADDALGAAATCCANDNRVAQVVICTPDKDLAQCVAGTRVVQLDRRSGTVLDEQGVIAKYGVAPRSIPDWLALVGDSADGFPGLAGWGRQSAARVLAHFVHLDQIPDDLRRWPAGLAATVRGAERLVTELSANRSLAELFRELATLRLEPPVLNSVDELVWPGPRAAFESWAARLGEPVLWRRARALAPVG